jgi:GNAT superfamily N-acetyltransferase
MHAICELRSPEEKEIVSRLILRALPEWFGVEEATLGYIEQSKTLPVFAAYDGDAPVGFLALKIHNEFTAEVCVMGVLPGRHRQGIGRRLIERAESFGAERGMKYLTVKTLADRNPDAGYARTRQFYRAMGFVPLEVFPLFWDERNPCLFMVKSIGTIK